MTFSHHQKNGEAVLLAVMTKQVLSGDLWGESL